MIVLFVNAHRATEEGRIRFKTYYEQINKILKNTIYYGNEIREVIRDKSELEEYIYDQVSYQCDPKVKEVFSSLEYVFIDGDVNVVPWSKPYESLLLFIKCCMRQNKKIHCNGFAHFAAYFYLSTMFDKNFYICSSSKITEENQKKVDYEYEPENGDLSFRGKKICNSGLKVIKINNRPFSAKSRQAVNNGVVLPTKYHYVVFNSKNGQKILNNINFPFTFYWKGNILCTSKTLSKAKADILVETELGNPFAFTYKSCLATQGLSCEFLKIIQNWLNESVGKLESSQSKLSFEHFQTISIDNRIHMKKSGGNFAIDDIKTLYRIQSSKNTKNFQNRPLSSKLVSTAFEKPVVRCGGRYQTEDERYEKIAKLGKDKNLGRSRMLFKGNLAETEIKNYVTMAPSRPVTAHKYRQCQKQKWISDKNFFLS